MADQKSLSDDGEYSICLPLYDGRNATMTGLRLSKVTSKFETDVKIRHKQLAGKFWLISSQLYQKKLEAIMTI